MLLTIILWIFTLFCMGLAVLSLFSEATVLLFSVIVFWVVVSVFLWWLAWLSDKRRPRKPKQPKPIPDQEIVQETLTEEKIENVVPPQDPSRSVPEGKSYSLLMVFILLIIWIPIFALIYDSFIREPTPAELAAKSAEDAEKAEQKRIERIAGFHCLSLWDGSSIEANKIIKKHLLVPDSYEHIETRITPRGYQNLHEVYVRFQSQSAIGLMIVQDAKLMLKNHDCSVESVEYIVNVVE